MSLFWRSNQPKRAPAVVATVPTPLRSWTNLSIRPETSLQKVAVWATIDLLSSLVSEIPVDVYQGTGPGKIKTATPRHLEDPAGDGSGLEDWMFSLMGCWLLRGNGVGFIRARSRHGTHPTAVELLHPDRTTVHLDADNEPVWTYEGQILPPESVFHRRVYPVAGELLGMSPVQYHATTIGMSLAITQFGYRWFQDGAHPSGMLTNSEVELNDAQAQTAKARFRAALLGTREPLVLGKGWAFQSLQINPEESQFLESGQFSAAECARIYGPGLAEILGYESGASMTYANIESRFVHLLVLSLNKWLRRMERTLSLMLPRGQYARMNRDALLQPTTLDRLRGYQLALANNIRTVNEVRELEDLPRVPWGDVPISLQTSAEPDEPGDPTHPEEP